MFDIFITGSIGYDVTEEWFREQLNAAAGEPVRLLVNSGGGSVLLGKGIIAMIRDYAGYVTAEITGLAASMASAIAVSADKLIVNDQSIFMLHRAATSAYGNISEMEKTKALLSGIDDQLSLLYAAKSGMSVKKALQLMDDETYLFGEEIIDMGFADEFKSSDSVTDKALTLTEAKAQFAACYHPPTDGEVAAYIKNSDIAQPLSAEDQEAAKLFQMTPIDFRKYSK